LPLKLHVLKGNATLKHVTFPNINLQICISQSPQKFTQPLYQYFNIRSKYHHIVEINKDRIVVEGTEHKIHQMLKSVWRARQPKRQIPIPEQTTPRYNGSLVSIIYCYRDIMILSTKINSAKPSSTMQSI